MKKHKEYQTDFFKVNILRKPIAGVYITSRTKGNTSGVQNMQDKDQLSCLPGAQKAK